MPAGPFLSEIIPSPAPSLPGFPSPSAAFPSYARILRPHLPAEAFTPDPTELFLVGINIAILLLGWAMADQLDRWPTPWLMAWLPFALIMGNSVFVLGLLAHDLLHGGLLKGRLWRKLIGLVAFSMLWMTPSLWSTVHNRLHHGKTNGLKDPDRSYLESQPISWGKGLQNCFIPSNEVHPVWLIIGLANGWLLHNFRHLWSLLRFNTGFTKFEPSSFRVSEGRRSQIAVELLAVVMLNGAVILWMGLSPLKLFMGYLLPIWIGCAITLGYVYTQHMLSPLSDCNDALSTTLSLDMHPVIDLLHLNFSHHAEHHVFPGMNSNYYPRVRELLRSHFGDRYQELTFIEAWKLLLGTPRYYRDAVTLVNWDGRQAVPVPLLRVPPDCGNG